LNDGEVWGCRLPINKGDCKNIQGRTKLENKGIGAGLEN